MPAYLALGPIRVCATRCTTLWLSWQNQVFLTLGGRLPKDPTGTLTAKTATGSPHPAGSRHPQGTPTPTPSQGYYDAHLKGQHHEGAGQIFLERDPTFITTSCRFNTEVQPI